ncbi:(2Fe-2S)-binding protein [Paenibacillus sp. FSL H8-0537]|uniref:(2Fe-2S)-binding protein n=1 Tax=Paenibacillus sp. FSL H8-0537 TaxID=2921399 RepID=UPI0031016BD0
MEEYAQQEQAACFLQQNFRISIGELEKEAYPFSAVELLDPTRCSHIMRLQSRQLEDPGDIVVGTLFAKRYAVFFMGLVSAVSLFDCRLAIAPESVRFRITSLAAMEYQVRTAAHPSLTIFELEQRKVEVENWTDRLLQHTEMILAAVSSHTGAKVNMMWSLISNYVQNSYVRLEQNVDVWRTEQRWQLILADRSILLEQRKGNPLAVSFREFHHPQFEGAPIVLRRYCCLAYRLRREGQQVHGYCSTCPKISDEERLDLLGYGANN